MQDATDYSDTAVTALIEEATAIAEAALSAARETLAKYGDQRFAEDYATWTLGGIDYFSPAIDRYKFAKDGDGTVPAALSAASSLSYWASPAAKEAGNLRRRIAKGTDTMSQAIRGRHESEVRSLNANLKGARKALAEYQAAVRA